MIKVTAKFTDGTIYIKAYNDIKEASEDMLNLLEHDMIDTVYIRNEEPNEN